VVGWEFLSSIERPAYMYQEKATMLPNADGENGGVVIYSTLAGREFCVIQKWMRG
jgi:hypothetical protein